MKNYQRKPINWLLKFFKLNTLKLECKESIKGLEMKNKGFCLFICILLILSMSLSAKPFSSETIGSPKKIDEGYKYNATDPTKYVVGENSSLYTKWVTFHDDQFPADLKGTVGLKPTYWSNKVGFRFASEITIIPKEDLSATEVIFRTLDMWGNTSEAFAATFLEDMKAGTEYLYKDLRWGISEAVARDHLISIAYIASVRTKSGKVYSFDENFINQEIANLLMKYY